MQVDQREALDDPRPVIGVMAHAYPNPLEVEGSPTLEGDGASTGINLNTQVDDVSGDDASETTPSLDRRISTAAEAAAAATELVIDALLAVEAETIGPEVRFIGLPRATDFPPKKTNGGAWRGQDGLRVVEDSLPEGLVKRAWLRKHTRDLPGSLVYFAQVDVSATTEAWASTEDGIVSDLKRVIASLSGRDIRVLLVLVKMGVEAGHTGGREEREVAEERALSIRRRCEVDTRFAIMANESELASRNNPPSMRRIAKTAKDMAVAHYAAHITRLRRWEKVLVPSRRLYRPLLIRLYFKLGVLHEMQGIVDRSVLCYQEVAALLSEMIPRKGETGRGGSGGGASSADGVIMNGSADSMEQIRGVAEVVHLRLIRNHLQRNMSVEAAVRQLRRHVTVFGRPVALSAGGNAAGGGIGRGTEAGQMERGDRESGAGVVMYRHYAWMSRQFLTFGEMLGEHLSQFSLLAGQNRMRGDGGGLGYISPGYYFLSAALQAVRRRKSSERSLDGVNKEELAKMLDGLEVQGAVYLGEGVRLVDPKDPGRDLRRECRAFLDLEEAKVARSEVARSLLGKALEHLPADKDVLRRRRVLVLSHLGEESFVAGRYEQALQWLPPVWTTYLQDGWLQLAVATLRRMYVSAWMAGKAEGVVDAALRLCGKPLWPWVSERERKRLLLDALPLIGAAATCAPTNAPDGGVEEDSEGGIGAEIRNLKAFVGASEAAGPAAVDKPMEAKVDKTRLVMRVSGKFCAKEASPGDVVMMDVGLLSLLPVELELGGLELLFSNPALKCVIKGNDARSSWRDGALKLEAMGLLRIAVTVRIPFPSTSPSSTEKGASPPPSPVDVSSSLRLEGARVIARRCARRDPPGEESATPEEEGMASNAGVEFGLSAGSGSLMPPEWALETGWESLRLVAPRAKAQVHIGSPPPLLLGAITKILVTVSAPAAADAGKASSSSGAVVKATAAASVGDNANAAGSSESQRDDGMEHVDVGARGSYADPFRDGFLFLECEPAPVPPPIVPQSTATAATLPSPPEGTGTVTPSSLPPIQTVRPRPERAFFWEPAGANSVSASEGGTNTGGSGDGSGDCSALPVPGFLAMAVGPDGQPVTGIPLREASPAEGTSGSETADEGCGGIRRDISIPVWVRSETAGKVTMKARVVYGASRVGEGGSGGGEEAEGAGRSGGVATEWARVEVQCVRPLNAIVDVVALQDDAVATSSSSARGSRAGHTVAVRVTVTNLQARRLAIYRMEVLPPQPSSTSPASLGKTISPASLTPKSDASNLLQSSTSAEDSMTSWAHLPNGPIVHDASRHTCGSHGATSEGIITLAGTGDSYSCYFIAVGDIRRVSPLGKLRVTWKPERESDIGGAGGAGIEGEADASASLVHEGVGDGSRGVEAFTQNAVATIFQLPILAARPPLPSARLKAPPHARVGEAFSIRWEISNPTSVYSSMRLRAEEGEEFVWSGKRECMLQLAPSETISVPYRLVPLVPGHVLLPKVSVIPESGQVNIVAESSEGRSHIFVRP